MILGIALRFLGIALGNPQKPKIKRLTLVLTSIIQWHLSIQRKYNYSSWWRLIYTSQSSSDSSIWKKLMSHPTGSHEHQAFQYAIWFHIGMCFNVTKNLWGSHAYALAWSHGSEETWWLHIVPSRFPGICNACNHILRWSLSGIWLWILDFGFSYPTEAMPWLTTCGFASQLQIENPAKSLAGYHPCIGTRCMGSHDTTISTEPLTCILVPSFILKVLLLGKGSGTSASTSSSSSSFSSPASAAEVSGIGCAGKNFSFHLAKAAKWCGSASSLWAYKKAPLAVPKPAAGESCANFPSVHSKLSCSCEDEGWAFVMENRMKLCIWLPCYLLAHAKKFWASLKTFIQFIPGDMPSKPRIMHRLLFEF